MKKLLNLNSIMKLLLLTVVGIIMQSSSPFSFAANASGDLSSWSAMFYYGGTARKTFGQVILGQYKSFGETIYAAELAYTLDKNNSIRRFFKSLFDTVQIAGNFAYRHDYAHHDDVKEGNLYLTMALD